jgi:penicillin-binding protein 2
MVRGVTIKDHWSEQRIFDQRALAAGVIIVTLTFLLIARLFLLQVIRHDYYTDLSQGNRVRIEPIPATRGLILDRNGEVLASNQPAYQLELIPEQVPDLDKTLKDLVALDLLAVDDLDDVRRAIRLRRAFDSVPIRLRMSEEDIARFAVRRFEFPGVDIKTRQTRLYPNIDLAVHVGYVAAISEGDLAKIDRAAYAGTTLIGKLGVESSYEKELHGTNGFREVLVNAQGRSVQKQGQLVPDLRERAPAAGSDVLLAIDLPSQRVAEEALADKRGAAVAIDPTNGDVLVLVSRPGFDPNLFGRGLTRAEFAALNDNIDHPLLNRALRGRIRRVDHQAGHRAGRPRQWRRQSGRDALLQRRIRVPGSSRMFAEGRTGRHGAMDLRRAIAKSCDVYFCDLASTIGVDHIAEFRAAGLREPHRHRHRRREAGPAALARVEKKAFARPADQMWFPGETVNFGIGQGYFLVTPLQLAHYTSILANRGASFRPRLVNAVREPGTGQIRRLAPVKGAGIKNVTPTQWQIVMEGMAGTARYGTAALTAGKNMTYTIAGKTGTAQVFSVGQNEKLDNQKTVSDRLRDHSWFIAFAPAEAPRIAVAVLVENGGFGSAVAAPIVRKIMDTYLLDASGQLKVPLPPGTRPLLPGPAMAPITPGKAATPSVPVSAEPAED